MLSRLRTLLSARPAPGAATAGDGDEDDRRRLAAAALLVHAASVDADYAPVERRRILSLLKTRFGLDAEEAGALAAAAETAVDGAVQILGFTRAIKDGFSYDERVALIEMLWQVVLSDGRLDACEAQLMRRIGGLLYVTDRDRGLARQRAAARLEDG